MGDEQIGQPQIVLQLPQKVEHLGLDGDVESGNRFVADHEAGMKRQGPRHSHPLPLASGEFMGESVGVARVEPHHLEEFPHSLASLFPVHVGVHRQLFADRLADPHSGIERGVGVLKDNLHLLAELTERMTVGGGDVDQLRSLVAFDLSSQQHASGGGFDQPQDAPGGGGFAATRLSHQPQGGAPRDIKRDSGDGRDHFPGSVAEDSPSYLEVLHQVADGDGQVGAQGD